MKALVVLGLLVPALAGAQTFELAAEKATPAGRLDDIVWAFVGACTAGDDIQQRQCRLVRDKRAKELAGQTLLVDGETAALELGKYSAQRRSMGVVVTTCIRCGSGVEVEGKKYLVIGAGTAPRWEGGRLRTQVVHDTTKLFDDEAAATAWTKSLEHARVQYLVKVPDRPKWTSNGRDGFSLEVLGYRVFAPCDGAVVAAKPPSQAAPPDKSACKGLPVTDPAPTGTGPEKLPEALTGAMIKAAMQPVLDAANACFDRYKVSGKAKLVMVVSGDGSLLEYAQEGELVGTPIAPCIDTAAKKVKFPRTQKPSTKIGFPIVLR